MKKFLLTLLATALTFAAHAQPDSGKLKDGAAGACLADKSATPQARRLYGFLKSMYGVKTVSSVVADVNWNHDLADSVYAMTGKYPAINCYDFIHVCVPANDWIDYGDITPVTEWADEGGIVALMWHFNVPLSEATVPGPDGSGVTCTPELTTFRAANALVDGTWENRWLYGQMDKVADVMIKLQDAGVAALWRPFHEAAGNATRVRGDWTGKAWFWWGRDGAETYKRLWAAMFDHFRRKGVHNLVWVWTTQNRNGDPEAYDSDDEWYPGDSLVDIIGRDTYGYGAETQRREFLEIQERYPGKMVALAECGTEAVTGAATAGAGEAWEAGARWSYFMPWYGANFPSAEWWRSAMSSDAVVTRGQLGNASPYAEESARDAVARMGLGLNLGNTLDSYPAGKWFTGTSPADYETSWGQPQVTRAMADFLKAEGFGAVRLPVTWAQHMDSLGNVDGEWMDRVQEVVDYFIGDGMYCILNVHHDTGADSKEATSWIKADTANYAANRARFENLWTQIADRFKGYSHKLLFEGYNEMLDAHSTWNAPLDPGSYEGLNGYARSFVSAVRATGGNNSTRNLIVSTYAAASGPDVLDALVLPTDSAPGHLAVEVHTYAPWDWFAKKGAWDDACRAETAAMFSRLDERFVSKGVPVIIGEYGTHGSASVGPGSTVAQKRAAADQAADIVSLARARGAAAFYWNSVFDSADRSVPRWTLPEVVEAMRSAQGR